MEATMLRNTILKMLLPLLFLITISIQAQYSIQINVVSPLPVLNIADLLVLNSIPNNQQLFSVIVTPPGGDIVIKGRIDWKKIGQTSYVNLYDFNTHPFPAQTFSNTNLGNSIRINQNQTNSTEITNLITSGVFTGTIKVVLGVYSPSDVNFTNPLASDEKLIELSNPSNNIIVLSPQRNSLNGRGNVIAIWLPVPGVSNYVVKVAKRNAGESPEQAIESGTIVINNYSVGSNTSVNLFTLPTSSSWENVENAVVRVSAVVPGLGGQNTILSEPIPFTLLDPGVNPASTPIPPLLLLVLGNFIPELAALFQSGVTNITSITLGDGTVLQLTDLLTLLTNLMANPDNISNINFTPGN